MESKEFTQLVQLIGNQGLGFFALYIVYHYTNQILGSIVILVLAKRILNIIEKWLKEYIESK